VSSSTPDAGSGFKPVFNITDVSVWCAPCPLHRRSLPSPVSWKGGRGGVGVRAPP
jgi:hypothetical protein